MRKTYDLEYLLKNKGTYSEQHIKQLVGCRTEVLFSEIWSSSAIPYWEKMYFWLKNTELSNDEKLLLGLTQSKVLCDSLIAGYPPAPSVQSKPGRPYQPNIIPNSYVYIIESLIEYLNGNAAVKENIPGFIKSFNLINSLYRNYFSGNSREYAIISIGNVLTCFTPGYVQDYDLMSEFIESSVYAAQDCFKNYVDAIPTEQKESLLSQLATDGETLYASMSQCSDPAPAPQE